MADTSKYRSVSLRHETYQKLKDLQHHNENLTISIASAITYCVNKEHRKLYGELCPYADYGAVEIPRSSSAGKSNDS